MLLSKFNAATLAVLAIEPREIDQKGQPKKKFKVPVLRYRPNLAQGVFERGGVRDASQVQMLVSAPVSALPMSPVLRPGEQVISQSVEDMPAEQVEAHVVEEEPAGGITRSNAASEPPKTALVLAYEQLGVTKANASELKQLLVATETGVDFTEFCKAQAELGVKGSDAFRQSILNLMPVSVAAVDPAPVDPDHDPFATKPAQEGLGGLG
jgi:hypothetical protein